MVHLRNVLLVYSHLSKIFEDITCNSWSVFSGNLQESPEDSLSVQVPGSEDMLMKAVLLASLGQGGIKMDETLVRSSVITADTSNMIILKED